MCLRLDFAFSYTNHLLYFTLYWLTNFICCWYDEWEMNLDIYFRLLYNIFYLILFLFLFLLLFCKEIVNASTHWDYNFSCILWRCDVSDLIYLWRRLKLRCIYDSVVFTCQQQSQLLSYDECVALLIFIIFKQ